LSSRVTVFGLTNRLSPFMSAFNSSLPLLIVYFHSCRINYKASVIYRSTESLTESIGQRSSVSDEKRWAKNDESRSA